jgi:hypothetical protein
LEVAVNVHEKEVQQTRSRNGLLAVLASDAAIAVAAIVAVIITGDEQLMGAVLTGAITAISTLTTAYFGIRAVTNTAQAAANQP